MKVYHARKCQVINVIRNIRIPFNQMITNKHANISNRLLGIVLQENLRCIINLHPLFIFRIAFYDQLFLQLLTLCEVLSRECHKGVDIVLHVLEVFFIVVGLHGFDVLHTLGVDVNCCFFFVGRA